MKLYPFDINGQEMMLSGDDIYEMDCLLVKIHGFKLHYDLIKKSVFSIEYLTDDNFYPYVKARFNYIPNDIRNLWWMTKKINESVDKCLNL